MNMAKIARRKSTTTTLDEAKDRPLKSNTRCCRSPPSSLLRPDHARPSIDLVVSILITGRGRQEKVAVYR